MKRIIFILLIISAVTTSCRKDFNDKQQESIGTMSDMEVSDSFNWKTTKDYVFNLSGSTKDFVQIKSTEGDIYYKALLYPGKEHITKVTIPSYVKQVELVYLNQKIVVQLDANKIDYSFNR